MMDEVQCPRCGAITKRGSIHRCSVKKNHSEQPLDMVTPEPTDLTRDQAIRAKALEIAISRIGLGITVDKVSPADIIDRAKEFEDYIREGRKGDE